LIKKHQDSKVEDIDILNILSNKEADKILEKHITDNIVKWSEDNTSGNAKSEEQNCKMYLSEINNF